MPGILDGVTIVDMTGALAGPGGTMLLAEMGANVIHIEAPPTPIPPANDDGAGRARTLMQQMRSKRSIAIDLTTEAGRELVYEFTRDADCFYQNWRHGVARQLRMDYESIRAVNPSIVYTEVTANGAEGPDAERVAYDMVAQAGAGDMAASYLDPALPIAQPNPVADVTAMCLGALGTLAALWHRRETGEGQRVTTSLLDGAVLQNILRLLSVEQSDREWRSDALEAARAIGAAEDSRWDDVLNVTATSLGGVPLPRDYGVPVPELTAEVYYRCYRTADGWIALGALGATQARVDAVLELNDPRFHESEEDLDAALTRMRAECTAKLATKTSTDWLSILDAARVPCGPVRHTLDLFEDEHIWANGMMARFDDPDVGELRWIGHPLHFERTPMTIGRSPRVGEDGDELLAELGKTAEEVAALRETGVVCKIGPPRA
jgi:crotonobetainyl-CoA:carnitine CoA-transferase CaiB-like acyl-CoA transferase